MSQKEFTSTTKKYIASSDGQNNTSKIGKTSKNLETEETKRTRMYKFQYSNSTNKSNHKNNFKSNFNNKNNFKKLKENSNKNSTNNNYIDNTKYMHEEIMEKSDNDVNKGNKSTNYTSHINNSNSKHINKKKILYTEAQSNESPSKLNLNYETNYSINNQANAKYIIGTNKNIYQKSYIRTPDIEYRSYKNKQNVSEADGSNIILEENDSNSDKYIEDAKSDCTFGKRKYNESCSYEENKIETSEEKDRINNKNNINNINDNYLNNKRKIINKKYYVFGHNNLRNIRNVRYNGRIIKVESIPIIFSDEEKNKKNKEIIIRNNSSDVITNRSIKISKYSKINTKYGKSKNLRNINKVKNIRINNMNNFNNIDNLYLCRCKRNYNIKNNNQCFKEKDLRMQNAQNMQVIQDEMIRILIPIPPNKIDYACDLEIYGKTKKKYTSEEINKIKRKKKIIEENELIKTREEENNKMKNIRIKKPNWNLTNEVIKATNLSYQNKENKNEKTDINNKEFHEIKILKEKKGKKQNMNKNEYMYQFNIENFNINISDDGRKFRGEMLIENNKLELEKQVKDPNSNLLLSPNEVISYDADYPRKNWNSIIKPISGRSFSLENKYKKVLIERSVEKLSFKGNAKPCNDWNIFNNAKKEVNINLFQKKKKQNLSKQRIQPIAINGKKKNWSNLTTKENESKLIIRGTKNKKKKENEKEHEEVDEAILNNDYNKIKESKKRSIILNIKKEKEKSDESISSEIDAFKNINIYNGHLNQYKNIILDSFKSSEQPRQKIIINDISRKYPKRIETYQGNDENKNNEYEIIQVIEGRKSNYVNILQNPSNEKKSYSQKIVLVYQDNEINNKNISYSELTQQSPQKKYYYREIITNNNIQISSQNDSMKNNIEAEEHNNNYSNKQSDEKTSNSDFKRSYREEIIINEFNLLNK